MSYDTQRVLLGRQPITVAEMDLDFCRKDYGQSSTNLLTYSEDFSNASWLKSNFSVDSILYKAPDGTKTANKVYASAAANTFIYKIYTTTSHAGNTYSFSLWMKNISNTGKIALRIRDGAGTEVGFKSVDITTEWKRYFVTGTFGASPAANIAVYIDPVNDSPIVGDAILVWGGQLNAGQLKHYTPTTTTSATSSCTASGSSGNECYNTRKTCQAQADYAKLFKTYRFCQPMAGLPVTVDMIPAISGKVISAPTKITPGKGLGYRATISIKIRDFSHHDRGIDPYVSTRSYTPQNQGTFWGKFLARNPYFIGRTLRVRAGFVTDPWDWAHFQDRVYIIDDIKGPDKNGVVTITGKDPITLANDNKAQCPAPSTGVLSAAINTTDMAFTLSPTGIGNSEYPASGTVRIGSEEMTFTRSGDSVTITARNVNGTEVDDHDADDIVQLCKVYTTTNIVDVVDDLLNNYVDGFDAASWIPYDQGISGPATGTDDEWDEEKGFYLSSADVTRTIGKPTGVNKLLSELTEQFLFNLYWHETEQKIKLRAIAPPKSNAAVPAYDDDINIIKDSLQLVTDEKQRVSQVWVYYSKIDNSGDSKPENYHNLYIAADVNQEDADLYGLKQVQIIYADWIYSQAQAVQLAGRILARFYESPKVVTFHVDAKDGDKKPGDLVDITTRFIQSASGAEEETRFEILEATEVEQGHKFKYHTMVSQFNGLYGFIGPDTLNDYSSESAANRRAYAFICPDSGLFADGTAGYKII